MLSDVRSLCVKAETSAARLRRAVGGSDLPPNGAGLGAWVDEELSLRCAVSFSLAFLGVRRASEIAALTKADVVVDEPAGVVELGIRCRKNDQLGVGQMARIVALPAWKGACPMRLLADWLRFRCVFWPMRLLQTGCRVSATEMDAFLPFCRSVVAFPRPPFCVSAVWRSSACAFRFMDGRVCDYGGAEEMVGL